MEKPETLVAVEAVPLNLLQVVDKAGEKAPPVRQLERRSKW
jgi:hypothetical protein